MEAAAHLEVSKANSPPSLERRRGGRRGTEERTSDNGHERVGEPAGGLRTGAEPCSGPPGAGASPRTPAVGGFIGAARPRSAFARALCGAHAPATSPSGRPLSDRSRNRGGGGRPEPLGLTNGAKTLRTEVGGGLGVCRSECLSEVDPPLFVTSPRL